MCSASNYHSWRQQHCESVHVTKSHHVLWLRHSHLRLRSTFAAIGSGGPYALAAARALIDLPDYDAKTIGRQLHLTLLQPDFWHRGKAVPSGGFGLTVKQEDLR